MAKEDRCFCGGRVKARGYCGKHYSSTRWNWIGATLIARSKAV